MAYNYFSPDGNASHKHSTHNLIQTEGTECPIYDPSGELIKNVPVCWDWCKTGNEIEISDVRYGSIDGIILPHWDDIVEAIQTKMGLREVLIFPSRFHHEPKL